MELKLHRENLEDIIRKRTIEISKSHYKLHQEVAERIQIQKALIEQRAYFLQLFEKGFCAFDKLAAEVQCSVEVKKY